MAGQHTENDSGSSIIGNPSWLGASIRPSVAPLRSVGIPESRPEIAPNPFVESNTVSTDESPLSSTLESSDSPAASQTLKQYHALLEEEKTQRDNLYDLERQIATYGPLEVAIDLELKLNEEREQLELLRAEIGRLERKLDRERRAYEAAKAAQAAEPDLDTRRRRIEDLETEIAHKRKLAGIYEERIRYLEQQKAWYDLDPPIKIINDINQTYLLLVGMRDEIAFLERLRERGEALRVEAMPIEDVAPALIGKLIEYHNLQRREQQLRESIFLIERKQALYGPLDAPAHLAISLASERAQLKQLQGEITRLERQLRRERADYAAAEAAQASDLDIRRERIVNLALDLSRKRELERIYQGNVRYLEQLQAKLGTHTPPKVSNEIAQIEEQRERIAREMQALETQLQQEFGVPLEWLRTVQELSDRQIAISVKAFFAEWMDDQRKERRLHKR